RRCRLFGYGLFSRGLFGGCCFFCRCRFLCCSLRGGFLGRGGFLPDRLFGGRRFLGVGRPGRGFLGRGLLGGGGFLCGGGFLGGRGGLLGGRFGCGLRGCGFLGRCDRGLFGGCHRHAPWDRRECPPI